MTEETPQLEDIGDFVEEQKLSMDVLLAHENPYRKMANTEGYIHWSCKIINEQKQFVVVYFSKGAGIRTWCDPPRAGITSPVNTPPDKVGKPYDGPMPPFESEIDAKTFAYCSQPTPPSLVEVLDILAQDIWLVERTGIFERWVQVLKASPDSRAAKSAFDTVCEQRLQFMALLGPDAYHKLLYEIERTNPFETDDESI